MCSRVGHFSSLFALKNVPSGPLGRGELPPVLHQCPDEIENGEAFENPARVLGCAASEHTSRPSGRLQLAPAGHVRSIVNSVCAILLGG